jgi:carbamoylphosphate synthase large subunit
MRIGFGRMGPWEPLIREYADPGLAVDFLDLGDQDLTDSDLTAYDAIIPLLIFHYEQLSQRATLRGVKFIHPDPDVVALCDDKLRFAQFMTANGFGAFIPGLRSRGAPYPYIWKKRHGVWGMNCTVVATAEDETAQDAADDSWFAQEYVSGSIEYATNILRVDGVVRYVSTYRHQMPKPIFVKGEKSTPLRTSFERGSEFIDIFTDILDCLEFEGTACFDYKVEDGQPTIFELNPRCGGSMRADVTEYARAYVEALTSGTLEHNIA